MKEQNQKEVSGTITYSITEEEIQKEITNYKSGITIQVKTDSQIREACIKSLIKHKVWQQLMEV